MVEEETPTYLWQNGKTSHLAYISRYLKRFEA